MGKPEYSGCDMPTVAGILAASAVLGWGIGEVIKTNTPHEEIEKPTTAEIDTCSDYAHERALAVCERIFCGPYMLEDVAKTVEKDCADGNVPEPGSDMDQCDKRGLTFAATVYRNMGELGESAERFRAIETDNCLKLKGHTGEPVFEAHDDTLDSNKLADIRACENDAVQAALETCAPERLCSQRSLRILLEGFLSACYRGKNL